MKSIIPNKMRSYIYWQTHWLHRGRYTVIRCSFRYERKHIYCVRIGYYLTKCIVFHLILQCEYNDRIRHFIFQGCLIIFYIWSFLASYLLNVQIEKDLITNIMIKSFELLDVISNVYIPSQRTELFCIFQISNTSEFWESYYQLIRSSGQLFKTIQFVKWAYMSEAYQKMNYSFHRTSRNYFGWWNHNTGREGIWVYLIRLSKVTRD